MTPIRGADFDVNAKPLAQAFAQTEVRRFKLHVALSETHKALVRGDVEEAERLSRAGLLAENAAIKSEESNSQSVTRP